MQLVEVAGFLPNFGLWICRALRAGFPARGLETYQRCGLIETNLKVRSGLSPRKVSKQASIIPSMSDLTVILENRTKKKKENKRLNRSEKC